MTPTPAGILAVLAGGEAFLQSETMTVGFNSFGGIGTFNPAPAGFRTDIATGLARVGLLPVGRDDIVLQGRAIEGFAVIIDGKTYANIALTGFTQIPGGWNDPTFWTGKVAGVAFEQRVSLVGNVLTMALTATNTTGKPVKLRLFRGIDPDQSDRYDTTHKVIAPGMVEVKLQGGGVVTLRDPAGKASVAVTAYNKAATIGAPLTGTRSADDVLQLVYAEMVLVPGEGATFECELCVK